MNGSRQTKEERWLMITSMVVLAGMFATAIAF
ncbi:hypothetical protein J2S05_000938 [Alkalicoccobacillus murimartini]|uniref:YnhF family membrane protein n=1 Tax=Alkalicoccobacillus murimartini TaxID=171685 RepID=A0ABT9YE88_9BACI|nr:hypothetical protein [Alkalicoccobacillus murimartini]